MSLTEVYCLVNRARGLEVRNILFSALQQNYLSFTKYAKEPFWSNC